MNTKRALVAKADAIVAALSESHRATIKDIAASAIARGYVTRADSMFIHEIVDEQADADLIVDITKAEIAERKGGKVFWGLVGGQA